MWKTCSQNYPVYMIDFKLNNYITCNYSVCYWQKANDFYYSCFLCIFANLIKIEVIYE